MDFVTTILETINETLAAGTAIIAVSLLLFNLTRNLRNRVARTSAIVLACVTFTYIAEAFISLGPDLTAHSIALRLQWIGIAFIPVATLHLSDALLATTGLPSRGRRRRIIRYLYLIGCSFLILATITDSLIHLVFTNSNNVSIQPSGLFFLYLIYFGATNGVAFYNVQRARKRCLTRGTERRMAYLQIAILTPALGIFPYSVLLDPGTEFTVLGLLLINISNIVIILMLIFLSYPLYFFGSDKPDRLVKNELLDFLLRGPATGLIALSMINFTTQASRIFSLPGGAFTPLAVVAAVLLWQWFVSLALPYLEKWLIYRDEDDEQINKLQALSQKILTRDDLIQLIEATLESICEFLRVTNAFVASFEGNEPDILQTIGVVNISANDIQTDVDFLQSLQSMNGENDHINSEKWNDFSIIPLYSNRLSDEATKTVVIGILALKIDGTQIVKLEDDEGILWRYIDRVEQSLDDMQLQTEIFNILEGLLPQFRMTRSRAGAMEYVQPRTPIANIISLPDREEFNEQVRAALRHYWGGPGISKSNLMSLHLVQDRIHKETDTPVNILRAILQDSIDSLRPDGERKMASPEWTLYNILELRFIEKKKVRDVARRMSMSEADLYRKQRVAIAAVADAILKQEKEQVDNSLEASQY